MLKRRGPAVCIWTSRGMGVFCTLVWLSYFKGSAVWGKCKFLNFKLCDIWFLTFILNTDGTDFLLLTYEVC